MIDKCIRLVFATILVGLSVVTFATFATAQTPIYTPPPTGTPFRNILVRVELIPLFAPTGSASTRPVSMNPQDLGVEIL